MSRANREEEEGEEEEGEREAYLDVREPPVGAAALPREASVTRNRAVPRADEVDLIL